MPEWKSREFSVILITCLSLMKQFFSSSIVWGVIGPQRMFGPGSTYRAIQWYWFLGALLPVLFYVLMRVFPRSPARFLSAPVMLGAMGWLPPYVTNPIP